MSEIMVKFNKKVFLHGDSAGINKQFAPLVEFDKYYPAVISDVGSFYALRVKVSDTETIPAHREEVHPFGPLNLDKWIKQQRNEQWKARLKLRIKALTEEMEALEKSDAEAQ